MHFVFNKENSELAESLAITCPPDCPTHRSHFARLSVSADCFALPIQSPFCDDPDFNIP